MAVGVVKSSEVLLKVLKPEKIFYYPRVHKKLFSFLIFLSFV